MSDDDRQNEPEAAPLPDAASADRPARPARPGFRSMDIDAEAGAWDEGPTNQTARYAPSARPVGQQLRSTLTELDDVLPPGRSAWDLSTNQTQQVGGAGSDGGAAGDGGWGAQSNRTQQYATTPSTDGASLQRSPAASSPWNLPGNETQQYAPSDASTADGPDPIGVPNTDLGPWGSPSNETQQHTRGPAPERPSADPTSGSAEVPNTSPWGDGSNKTQRFGAAPRTPMRGHSLAPPRQESTDPWGSANNNTALYARPAALGPGPLSLRSDLDGAPADDAGSERADSTEGTEPNPPAPRPKTEPYGVPLSSHEGEPAAVPGDGPSSLEEAARLAADEVRPHLPAPRPPPVGFAEIELDDDTETLDTDTSPADAWIVTEHGRGPRPPAGAARSAELHLDDDSDGWAMSPPSGVNRADTSGPHWPKATSPEDFELEPPQTDSGVDDERQPQPTTGEG